MGFSYTLLTRDNLAFCLEILSRLNSASAKAKEFFKLASICLARADVEQRTA